MATTLITVSISTSLITPRSHHNNHLFTAKPALLPTPTKPRCFTARAAKPPAGVEMPKAVPKLTEPFLGFTKTAEVWNSRACMIGLIGTFIVELGDTSDDWCGCGQRA